MHWTSLADFFAMGGYAAFIWPSVAVTVIVIGWLVFSSLMERRSARLQVAALERDGMGRGRARMGASQS